MGYEYIENDNLESPLKYNYTVYSGKEFMRAWYQSRIENVAICKDSDLEGLLQDIYSGFKEMKFERGHDSDMIFLFSILIEILGGLTSDKYLTEKQKKYLNDCVKTFEVRKRLYHKYSLRFKPNDEKDYNDIALYLVFACVCAAAYQKYQDLRCLNVLLKVNDTLLSQVGKSIELQQATKQKLLSYALSVEVKAIDEICKSKGVEWGS